MTRWLHPDSLLVVSVLFWATFVTSAALFVADKHLRSLIGAHWRAILCGLLLVMIWRIPLDGHYFHGLEYEDSYVYTVAARELIEHTMPKINPENFPYSIDVCAAGSLRDCQMSESYPEHLIGDPYVVATYSKLMGYKPDASSVVSIIAACISCFLIVIACAVISNDKATAMSAVVAFAITPIFAVQGIETSAEPVSNMCISLVLCFFLYLLRCPPEVNAGCKILGWSALAFGLLLSLTIKRENILLIAALPVLALLSRVFGNFAATVRSRRFHGILIASALGVLLGAQMNITQSSAGEMSLLHDFPLTVATVLRLCFTFLRSFSVARWYGCGVVFVALAILGTWRQRKLVRIPLLLFTAYVCVYALHIRSYYEMRSGDSDPSRALRFSMSLMSLWSILVGVGFVYVLARIANMRLYKNHLVFLNVAGVLGLAVLLITSYVTTTVVRNDFVEDEFRVRIFPAVKALQVASQDQTMPNYVITLEPMLVQMYGSADSNVLDMELVDKEECRALGLLNGESKAVLLEERIHQSPADIDRYRAQIAFLSGFARTPLYRNEDFTVERIAFAGGSPAGIGDEGLAFLTRHWETFVRR